MWRLATPSDDRDLVEMCLGLYREDPGPLPVDARNMRETLGLLRREPWRGRPVVLDVGQHAVGYALLIAFWSNELGGEVCHVDELYVARDLRGRGHGAALFEAIERGDVWPAPVVALSLGTTPRNHRARRLYERLGFAAVGTSMIKRLRILSPMHASTAAPALRRGWHPGLLGDVVALHARYYAREWGFGSFFESKVAREMAAFAARYDPERDLILSAGDGIRTAGSITIDGSDPDAPDGLLHLRWFILADGERGRGIGRALLGESLAFARSTRRPGVYLWTFAGLDAARRLYDGAGFRLVEENAGATWGTRVTEQRFLLEFA